MAQKRKDWNGLISGFKASDLVFLDESGCNTDMTRRYAYSLGGSRAVDSAPLSKPKNTTILSSLQLDGTFHYTTFSDGTTVEHYLKEDLLPHLREQFETARSVKEIDEGYDRFAFEREFYSTPDFPPEQEAAFREAWEVICALLAKKHRYFADTEVAQTCSDHGMELH